MKDAARLLGYLVATVVFGTVAAPILFWLVQWLATQGIFPGLATFDFETFFHRALLLGALLFLWPLLRSLRIKGQSDLGLVPNRWWRGDLCSGFLISAIPVLGCGSILVLLGNYSIRTHIHWGALAAVTLTAAVVPFIEETFFRGLFMGFLVRSNRPIAAILLSAGFYSIVHFLKAPDQTSPSVGWTSGLASLAHSFDQFTNPTLVLAGFTTLFVIGVILSCARLRTRSLWLPIGLHAGWIFGNGLFNKIAHREFSALPWLGKSLLIGIVPLCVCFISWVLVEAFLRYGTPRES